MIRRRLMGHLAAIPVVALGQTALAAPPKQAAPAITVYHFLSAHCDDCQRWDSRFLSRWLNSGEFRRTAYRRIEGNTMEEALDPRRWPTEARPYAASLRDTPAFLVLLRGRAVAAAAGDEAWTQVIWPAIRRVAA